MKTIIDTLAEYTGKAPNEAILFDDDHSRGITYASMSYNVPFVWKAAGKILLFILLVVLILFLLQK